jgi:hypothetical protein
LGPHFDSGWSRTVHESVDLPATPEDAARIGRALVEAEEPSLEGEQLTLACHRGELVALAVLALGPHDLRPVQSRGPFADSVLDDPSLMRPLDIEHRLAHRLAIAIASYQDRDRTT